MSQVNGDGRYRWVIGDAGYETPCWIWLLYKDRHGYGKTTVGQWPNKTTTTAQRWVYEIVLGPVPDGLDLDHLCPNTSCVNPFHMEPVSHIVNVRRSRVQKLTQDVADQILARQGVKSGPKTAAEFGCSSTTVYDVWHGRRWAGCAS